MYHQRSSYLWEKTYLWPEKDVHLWRSLNKEKSGPALFQKVVDLAPGHDIIIQAGGACGIVPDFYSEHFKSVYTFEPEPENFHCLLANAGNPNVYKMNYLIGELPKKAVKIRNDYKNYGATKISRNSTTGTSWAEMTTIDHLNLKPNVIHLDIEGYEVEALKGAMETIKRSSPLIVAEYDKSPDLIPFLNSIGYEEFHQEGWDKFFQKK